LQFVVSLEIVIYFNLLLFSGLKLINKDKKLIAIFIIVTNVIVSVNAQFYYFL
jgi:hypothetical protein